MCWLLLLEEVIRYARVCLSCPERDLKRFIYEVTDVTDITAKRVTCPSLILDGHVLCDFVVKLFWEGVCLISRRGNRGELIALTGTVIHSDSSRSTSDWHSALGLCLTGVFWLTNEHRSPELSTVTIKPNKQGESETEAKTRRPLPSNVVYMLVCGYVWYLWEQNCGTRILNQRTPVANGCMSRVPVSWTAEEAN